MRPSPRHRPLLFSALVLVAGLPGCEKTTVTTQTPTGTTTTTTIGPSASASEGMARTGDMLADAALTAKVKAALIADVDVEASRVDVDSRDGAVKLSGTQTTEIGIERAVAIAGAIDGVKAVDNQLRFEAAAPAASEPGGVTAAVAEAASNAAAAAGNAIANGALTATVKAALLADPDVKGLQIDVDSRDGVVTLTGTLDHAAAVQRAQAIARRVDGVKSVESRLAVKPGG
jgi:hyperosmotically inducible protein